MIGILFDPPTRNPHHLIILSVESEGIERFCSWLRHIRYTVCAHVVKSGLGITTAEVAADMSGLMLFRGHAWWIEFRGKRTEKKLVQVMWRHLRQKIEMKGA